MASPSSESSCVTQHPEPETLAADPLHTGHAEGTRSLWDSSGSLPSTRRCRSLADIRERFRFHASGIIFDISEICQWLCDIVKNWTHGEEAWLRKIREYRRETAREARQLGCTVELLHRLRELKKEIDFLDADLRAHATMVAINGSWDQKEHRQLRSWIQELREAADPELRREAAHSKSPIQ